MKKKLQKNSTEFDIVYGMHPVLELIKAKKRKVQKLYCLKNSNAMQKIQQFLPNYLQPLFVSKQELERISGTTEHQGVCVFTTPFIFYKKEFVPEIDKFIIVCAEIQNVRNLGAIIRTGYCVGASGLIIVAKNAAPITAATIKAAAGLTEVSKLVCVKNLEETLKALAVKGYSIFCAALKDAVPISAITFNSPTVLVLGNEENGLKQNILKCGQAIFIPQKTEVISYNVSAAAAICSYLISKDLKLL